MPVHVMTARSAVELLQALAEAGVDACVGGGWAIDALLGEQTREHSDLDLWVLAADFDPLLATLVRRRIDRVLHWGGDRPWNFALHDGGDLRVDLHLYEQIEDGALHYGGVREGVSFPASALSGSGRIAGMPVRCDTPAWALQCHTNYLPREVDRQDVRLLCAKFGLDFPDGYP